MHTIISLYIKAATALKLPFQYRHEYGGIEVYLAGKKYFFRATATPFNDASSQDIALNKLAVNYLLSNAGFPVPYTQAILRENDSWDSPWIIPANIPYPVVVKPAINHGLGKDVFCNIQDEATLLDYLNEHKDTYTHVSLEKFEDGLTTFRVVVFFGKVVGVVRRDAAAVTGDGKHNIAQLIDIENVKRLEYKQVTHCRLKIDKECLTRLKELNLSLAYVPSLAEKITLCYTSNSSRGGTMISLGQSICKENADLACRAAKLLNLNLVGFDIICEDIMRPIQTSRGFFIEANSGLDFTINEVPMAGIPVPIASILLKKLIRKHPVAYAWAYLKHISPVIPLLIRGAFLLILLYGAGKMLHTFSQYLPH